MDESETPDGPHGKADTPKQAHDRIAPEVRRLRIGDDVEQSDEPQDDRPPPAA